jgi:hypothetical protein
MALTLSGRAPRSGQPRSPQERLWLTGGGIAGFALLLIGYFFFISPQRSDTSDVKSQIDAAQQQNTVLQARIDALREQDRSRAKYEAAYAQAQKALPTTSGVSDFLRSLQALGSATLTEVSSLTVTAPTSAAPAAAAPAAQTSPGAAPTSSTAATSAGSGTSATGTTGGPVYTMGITATVTGSPAALGKFLDQLQHVQPRAVLITQLTEHAGTTAAGAPAGTGATTSLQLTMQAFVAPSTPAEIAALAQAAGR